MADDINNMVANFDQMTEDKLLVVKAKVTMNDVIKNETYSLETERNGLVVNFILSKKYNKNYKGDKQIIPASQVINNFTIVNIIDKPKLNYAHVLIAGTILIGSVILLIKVFGKKKSA